MAGWWGAVACLGQGSGRESAARMLALMGGMRFASREPGHVGERGARTTLGK